MSVICVGLGAALGAGCAATEEEAARTSEAERALVLPPITAYLVGNVVNTTLAQRADDANAKVLGADFDGDDRMDLAILGQAGVADVLFGMSRGDGSFTVVSKISATFTALAAGAGVQIVAGDFNRDGRADLALAGGAGWTTIPVASSMSDGTLRFTNAPVATFPALARQAGARLLSGDFNGDGCDDLALAGSPSSSTIPVAFSTCDGAPGAFTVTNRASPLAALASESGVSVAVGDFDDNGQDDLVLAGGATWTTVPFGFSAGDGSFVQAFRAAPNFPRWARTSGARLYAGDSNDDGRDDLFLIGGAGWTTVPVALMRRDGTLLEENVAVDNLPRWAATAHVTAAVGDLDRDGLADIALAGGVGWTSVPTARRRRPTLNLPPSPLELGEAEYASVACSALPSDVEKALDELCAALPWCSRQPTSCRRTTRELAAGTSVYRDHSAWNRFGGHGEQLANAALCLLKDLDQGSIPLSGEAGVVSGSQRIGFSAYDADTRSVTGYQNVELCAPLLGCLRTPAMTFTATVRKSNPANPGGTTAGSRVTRDAYGLEVSSDEANQVLFLQPQAIPIHTPYGDVTISPDMTYQSNYRTIEQPGGLARKDDFLGLGAIWFQDLYGRYPGVQFIDAAGATANTGWWSQLSFGSRDARPSGSVWNGSGVRPDMDLSTARWGGERLATHDLKSTLDVRYSPMNLLPSFLNSWPLHVKKFEIYSTVVLQARASGQLALGLGQGTSWNPDHERQRSSAQLRQGFSVAQDLSVKVGFILQMEFDTGFLGWVDLPSIDADTTIPIDLKDDLKQGPAAVADVRAEPSGPIYYDQIRTLHNTLLDDQQSAAFLGRCLASPSSSAPLPPATYTAPSEPWNLSVPYACNLCAGVGPTEHNNPVGYGLVCPPGQPCPVTARAPDAGASWTCDLGAIGCYDICSDASGSPQIIRSAPQNELRCAEAPR
ncbi:MAG: VCBS repeat-containing protein [Kofleriaceae bacterium]